jgi:hypothetical protein
MKFLKTLKRQKSTGMVRVLNASSDRRFEAAMKIIVRFQVCTRKVYSSEKRLHSKDKSQEAHICC